MNQLTISGNVGQVGEPKQFGDTTISEVSMAWNNPQLLWALCSAGRCN